MAGEDSMNTAWSTSTINYHSAATVSGTGTEWLTYPAHTHTGAPEVRITQDYEHNATRITHSTLVGGEMYAQDYMIINSHVQNPYNLTLGHIIETQERIFIHSIPEPITRTTATYGSYVYDTNHHYIHPSSNWYIGDDSYTHYNNPWVPSHGYNTQQKINKDWKLWLRNEKHSKNMQDKINREWWLHCENEKLIEAKNARVVAEDKALNLMGLLIGDDQRDVYKKTGRVFVKGKNGLYIVKRNGGVSKIKDNKIIDFCIHITASANCPPTDHAIALKLMLENDDKKVIKLANRMSTNTYERLPLAACM